jgi:hypothetical protein
MPTMGNGKEIASEIRLFGYNFDVKRSALAVSRAYRKSTRSVAGQRVE